MDKSVSAADAERKFSQLLPGVREHCSTNVVTSNEKSVAKLVPSNNQGNSVAREAAKKRLQLRLHGLPIIQIGPWIRDELYERD